MDADLLGHYGIVCARYNKLLSATTEAYLDVMVAALGLRRLPNQAWVLVASVGLTQRCV